VQYLGASNGGPFVLYQSGRLALGANQSFTFSPLERARAGEGPEFWLLEGC
jgi:hypothetical protein